ncbi:MAG TPA: hypothetical protein VIZ28_14285 [Chitinophagaceae bacterium]
MKYLLLLSMIILAVTSFSQSKVLSDFPAKSNSIESFIPEGYDTITVVKGDLNNDKVADIVMVLRHEYEKTEDPGNVDPDTIPSRILVVLFRKGKIFELAAASGAAIMCRNCGGIFGDPFEEVAVEKGILVIRHYGGSAWRWGNTHKFRFQKNAFFLIGQTTISYWNVEMCNRLGEFAATEYEDINFLTGGYIKKKISQEGCKLLVNKKGKNPVKPLVKLEDFSTEN